MKNTIKLMCLLLSIFCLYSCGVHKESQKNEETTITTVEEYEDCPFVAYDMEAFFSALQQSQAVKNGTLKIDTTDYTAVSSQNNLSTIEKLPVPVLKNENYRFYFVKVNRYSIFYYYVPTDWKGEFVDHEITFVVAVSKQENSYFSALEQAEISDLEGYAHDSNHNTWYINNNSKRISVSYPSEYHIGTKEKLLDCFTFDFYDVKATGITKIADSVVEK